MKKTLDWIRGYMESTNISATQNILGDFCKNIQRMSGSDAVTADSVRQLVATGSFKNSVYFVCFSSVSAGSHKGVSVTNLITSVHEDVSIGYDFGDRIIS